MCVKCLFLSDFQNLKTNRKSVEKDLQILTEIFQVNKF